MSLDLVQIIFPLTFLGVCSLVGEILVQGRREQLSRHSKMQ